MPTSTGAPWNLPSPLAPEQPDGPAAVSELAAAVHAALGSAYPCLSTARPPAEAGLLIFETDTQRLLWAPDGVTWRVLFAAPTVTATGGSPDEGGATWLTASTNFSVGTFRVYRTGGQVWFTGAISRLNTVLSAGTDGNITNTQMATIPAGFRPPLGNWQVAAGGVSGKIASGYVSETGVMAIGALCPGTGGDWTVGLSMTWSGSYPLGDG
jgi:hypothetical protein